MVMCWVWLRWKEAFEVWSKVERNWIGVLGKRKVLTGCSHPPTKQINPNLVKSGFSSKLKKLLVFCIPHRHHCQHWQWDGGQKQKIKGGNWESSIHVFADLKPLKKGCNKHPLKEFLGVSVVRQSVKCTSVSLQSLPPSWKMRKVSTPSKNIPWLTWESFQALSWYGILKHSDVWILRSV